MRIFITGATGLIGSRLVKELLMRNNRITILTRSIESAKLKFANTIEYCSSLDGFSLEGFDAVINLAGESIGEKRWTSQLKKQLLDSRLQITRKLAELIRNSTNGPQIFISGSAIGFYGDMGNKVVTETSVPGTGFTHDLCRQWEEAAMAAKTESVRVCLIRTAIVLAPKGGALGKLIPVFKAGLGASFGNGKQFFSWIHIDDMVGIISFLLENEDASGPVNMCSPHPVTNREFSKILASVFHRPCLFRIPAFALKIFIGEGAVLLLDSQYASSSKLESLGYVFRFPDLRLALRNLFA